MPRPMKIKLARDAIDHDLLHLAVGENSAQLKALDVEEMIEQLSYFRAAMKPQIPLEVSRTYQFDVEFDPSWYVEPHPIVDGLAFFLRHTGYGWTGFVFSDENLDRLCTELSGYDGPDAQKLDLPS